jgi:hypothetical protein
MASINTKGEHRQVMKRTSQGGSKPKTSAMPKAFKKGFKAYRGQGK